MLRWRLKRIFFAILWFGLLAVVSSIIGYFTNIFVVLPLTIVELMFLTFTKYDKTKDWEVVYAIFKVSVIISLVSMWATLVIAQIVLS